MQIGMPPRSKIGAVERFAQRLEAVIRAAGGQMKIARRAFPADDYARQRRYAAYLSRLVNEHEQNPSLNTLEWIARGMGLSVSAFFLQLEQDVTISQSTDLHQGTPRSTTAPLPTDEVGHGGSLPPGTSHDDDALGQAFIDLGLRLRARAHRATPSEQSPEVRRPAQVQPKRRAGHSRTR